MKIMKSNSTYISGRDKWSYDVCASDFVCVRVFIYSYVGWFYFFGLIFDLAFVTTIQLDTPSCWRHTLSLSTSYKHKATCQICRNAFFAILMHVMIKVKLYHPIQQIVLFIQLLCFCFLFRCWMNPNSSNFVRYLKFYCFSHTSFIKKKKQNKTTRLHISICSLNV